jgi:hypothetical protein
VAACKSGALALEKKETETVPPKDMDTLYEEIMTLKKGKMERAVHVGRKIIGI